MTAAHPDKTASSTAPAPVTGILRTDRTTVNNIFGSKGRTIERHFTYTRREYSVANAPDIRSAQVRYAIRPTGVTLSWSRMNSGAWELETAEVSGVRVLKSGAAGAAVPRIVVLKCETPQWLTAFSEAHRPAG